MSVVPMIRIATLSPMLVLSASLAHAALALDHRRGGVAHPGPAASTTEMTQGGETHDTTMYSGAQPAYLDSSGSNQRVWVSTTAHQHPSESIRCHRRVYDGVRHACECLERSHLHRHAETVVLRQALQRRHARQTQHAQRPRRGVSWYVIGEEGLHEGGAHGVCALAPRAQAPCGFHADLRSRVCSP